MTQAQNVAPHSPAAEESVVGQLLVHPKLAGQVIGTLLEPGDFFRPEWRAVYEAITESFFADDAIDPLTIGDACRKQLSKLWRIKQEEVPRALYERIQRLQFKDKATDHAKLVKRYSGQRHLLDVIRSGEQEVMEGKKSPEEIADLLSAETMKVATGGIFTREIESFADVGRDYYRFLQRQFAANQAGIELSAKFGLDFIDDYVKGLGPTELLICGGEPGVGKSALWWKASEFFARRQLKKPESKRIGALVLSLEMGKKNSSDRIAQSLTGIPGQALREGAISMRDIQHIAQEWAKQRALPLYFNFTSTLKASQLRALVVEAIRKYNVGLVVIDHFRYFDMDRRSRDPLEHDEDKARFLKEDVAKELNVAVVCLGHTIKMKAEDGRPRQSDLRGSGQVAAHADIVCFCYRPWKYTSLEQIQAGDVKETDAELIYGKNRNGAEGDAPYYFEPSRMVIRDR